MSSLNAGASNFYYHGTPAAEIPNQPYPNEAQQQPLNVVLKTERLFMRNIRDKSDLGYYYQIFTNRIAMERYMEGIPRSSEEVIRRHEKYSKWWAKTPISSYLVFLNENTAQDFLTDQEDLLKSSHSLLPLSQEKMMPLNHSPLKEIELSLKSYKEELQKTKMVFIGHVLIEQGEDRYATDAEISYVLLPHFWQRRYGTEAVEGIVKYAKELCQKKVKTFEGNEINALIATARPDNPGSWKLLEKNGFRIWEEKKDKFGAPRHVYVLPLE